MWRRWSGATGSHDRRPRRARRQTEDDEGKRLLRIIRRGAGSVVTWRRAEMVLLSAQDMPVVKMAEPLQLRAAHSAWSVRVCTALFNRSSSTSAVVDVTDTVTARRPSAPTAGRPYTPRPSPSCM